MTDCYLQLDKMQTTRKGCRYFIASHSFSISLIASVFWSPAGGVCMTEELTAFTTDKNIYTSPGFTQKSGLQSNKSCKVKLKAAYEADVVKVTVKDANLQLRGPGGSCTDKVIFYDGSSTSDVVLGEICGSETPTLESSGNTMLMSFNIFGNTSISHKGFRMEYYSLDRGGYSAYKSSSKSVSVGAIMGIAVPAVIIYCIVFIAVYRKCKHSQRSRQNANTTNTQPADLGMTTLTLLNHEGDQRSPLQKLKVSNGHGKHELPETPLSKTDKAKHNGMANCQKRPGRVRHPAGDLKCGELPHPPMHVNTYIIHDDNCSGYSSEWEEYPSYLKECPGVQHHYIHITSPLFTQDPSGVYYAGSIDEEGILHPPGEMCYPVYPSAPAPTLVSSIRSINHLSQLQDEDRVSRTSSTHSRRSPFPCGRESPSSGRGSPFRNRVNNDSPRIHHSSPKFKGCQECEGHTLTYYGLIDGDKAPPYYSGLSVNTDDNTSIHDKNLSVPPPSYEDAASGKYSPKF